MANAGATEVRTRLRLRATVPGANNRLDIAAIVSFDAGAGVTTPMFGAPPRLAARPLAKRTAATSSAVSEWDLLSRFLHAAQSSLGCSYARRWRVCVHVPCSVLAVRH